MNLTDIIGVGMCLWALLSLVLLAYATKTSEPDPYDQD